MNPVVPTGPGVAPGGAPAGEKPDELRAAAEAFEALLVQSLIKRMREAQLQEGFFGKGAGSSVYQAMFDQYLGERLAEGSPLGIADELEARWANGSERRGEALRAFALTAETLKFSAELPMSQVSALPGVGGKRGKP